jgi:hypothetical protein
MGNSLVIHKLWFFFVIASFSGCALNDPNGHFSNSNTKITIGATKDSGVQMFILQLAELLREQSSFKR